jgi:phthalate 4,5-cis-dihydrodiol dehydrogenase
VLRALYAAVRQGQAPLQAGQWGADSLKLCHAILKSAQTGGFVELP